jgi:demethylmenaquinone methyltransferase/2-methoxy-6-polyprenyl-1,4-benzoquinol methylase
MTVRWTRVKVSRRHHLRDTRLVRTPEDLLEEQIAYYRARAPEYDDWWFKRGRFSRPPEVRRAWAAAVDELEAAVDALGPTGAVLELAAGTGLWTERLARSAETVTAVDASSEVLDQNRRRTAGRGAPVTYVVADLFSWEPPRRYDVVFFSFWISHVPPARFDAFWDLVDRALEPGGRVFLIDNAPPTDWSDGDGTVTRRALVDGRTFDIVKVYWSPEDLTARLAPLGWRADLRFTGELFLYGSVVRG